eukprot:scaffold107112_cov17-Prasinocladus_malaysianus.AAC.1
MKLPGSRADVSGQRSCVRSCSYSYRTPFRESTVHSSTSDGIPSRGLPPLVRSGRDEGHADT